MQMRVSSSETEAADYNVTSSTRQGSFSCPRSSITLRPHTLRADRTHYATPLMRLHNSSLETKFLLLKPPPISKVNAIKKTCWNGLGLPVCGHC